MGKTISTHNGTAAHRGHNVRDPWATDKQEHIDKELSGQNETLHDEKPREAYERIFGEALRRYNEKQDRPERKIRDYFSHIEKDAKKNAVYEMIVQIGDRKDTGLDAPIERACLKAFYEGWKQRNPNLECIGAYLHADEKDGTLHMHIDYVPVAHGYKKGMETQNGLVKALGEMGFHKQGKETAQILWERRENEALEAICWQHGIEVEHPEGGKRKHMETELYKTYAALKEAQEDLYWAQEELSHTQDEAAVYQEKADKALAKAENADEAALEARRTFETVKGEVKSMQERKTVLEGKISVLEGQRAEGQENLKKITQQCQQIVSEAQRKVNGAKQELSSLGEQIGEARAELEVVETAIKRKMDEGAKYFDMDTMKERIAAARKEAEKENRLRLLEKFVSLPDIKELFEKFCQPIRGRNKKKNEWEWENK